METFDFTFNNRKKSKLPPPSVDAYYKIYHGLSEAEKVAGLCEWLASGSDQAKAYITPIDIVKAEIALSKWLRDLRQLPAYKPPHAKDDTPTETYFTDDFHELKMVSDYTNTSFATLRKCDILTFWRYYRSAIIHSCSKTEQGQEYLRKAYNQEQTKPDRAAIAAIIQAQG